MQISQAAEIFFTDREMRGCTKDTLTFYHWGVDPYLRTYGEQEVAAIQETVRPWLSTVRERPELSPLSQHRAMCAVRVFWRFCEAEEWCARVKIPVLKKPKVRITPLTQEQMAHILAKFDRRKFYDLRNYCILLTFYDTGVRLSELVGLDLQDVDFKEGFLRVDGKGGKERYAPFSKKLQRSLWQYVKVRECSAECEALFINQWGRRLGKEGIKEWFNRMKKKVPYDVRFSAHTLRHSFAMAFLENGGSLHALQKILGHEDPAMTLKYGEFLKTPMKKQHTEYSPGDRV